ncbi:MAG: helix-turn-helix transcriptional regulator [Bacteroidota bacterium]
MKPNNYDLKIAKNVKNLRVANGKCQKQVAFILKITVSYYNKYEHGLRAFTCGQLQLIAEFLGVPLFLLLQE